MSLAHDVANFIGGAKKSGAGYSVNCVLHDDSHKSLSLYDGDEDLLVVPTCHAGCDRKDLVHWLKEHKFLSDSKRPRKEISRVYYPFTDDKGKILYYEVRIEYDFGPKTCLPCDTDKATFKLPKVERVIYNMPKIAESNGETVFWVEGPKKAQAMIDRGALATTTLGGASTGKLIGKMAETALKNVSLVCILPDNDEAGQKYAASVSSVLKKLLVPHVIIDLPNLKPKGDVIDFFAAGGTLSDIQNLIEQKPPELCIVIPDIPDTDTATADIFCQAHQGKVKFVPESSKYEWMYFNGRYWQPDSAKMAERLAKQTCGQLWKLIGNVPIEHREAFSKWAKKSRNRERQSALLMVARSDERMIDNWDLFDKDPYLLPCGNGLLDLQTQKLMPFSPAYRVSSGTDVNYNPKVDQSAWLDFLNSSLKGNEGLIQFLQRSAGYTLSGSTKEEVFWYIYGLPRRGKGTFLKCLYLVLGGLAAKSAKEVWTKNSRLDPLTALGTYTRSRLIWVSEVGQDDQIDASRLKDFIGGDPMRGRKLFTDGTDFQPKAKLWIAGNHLMRMDSGEDVFGKMMPVVFDADVEKNVDLKDELVEGHLEAVLAWAVEGYAQYKKQGLNPPKEVIDFREEYRRYMDIIGQYLAGRCEIGTNHRASASELFKDYRLWCDMEGYRSWTQNRFGRELALRRFEKEHTRDGIYYYGLRLKTDYREPPEVF